MAKAIYFQRGESVDYRPITDTAAGEIIVQGKLVGVTRLDIRAGELGSVAVTGVFKVAKKATDVINAGAEVFFDGSVATGTSDDVKLGLAVASAAAGDEYVLVLLNA
jgi:predicted RecA/RadA family phage recombinase